MMRSPQMLFGILNLVNLTLKRESTILKRFLYSQLIIGFLLFGCSNLFAQVIPADTLRKKAMLYHAANPNDVLYVATDKDVYLPTETIWFAGYVVVEAVSKSDITLSPSILSVALLRDDTTAVSIRKNYLVSNWTSSGSLTLPENIEPGSYLLLAATNVVDDSGKPIHVFRRAITVRSATISSINVDFAVSEKTGIDSVFVNAKTIFPIGISAADRRNGELSYQFGDERPRKVKYGLDGNATIAFAKSELRKYGNLLGTVTKIGKTTKRFNIKLPVEQPNGLELGFYPEGGDLVSGLESRVALQSVMKNGTAQQARVLLLENGKVIDTIASDQFGMGTFSLRPKADAAYEAKLLSGDNTQIFKLPAILETGFVVRMANAVANDTLMVEIATSKNEEVSIAITNEYSKESEITPPFVVASGNKKLKLPLTNIKKGLNTFTLLDSLGRPVAERLFFAHFDGGSKATITTDKDSYGPREKVSMQISLADAENRTIGGLFTISCVQESRLDSTSQQDLAGYYYMKPIVGDGKYSLLNSSPSTVENKGHLEKVLMIRGWRRYLWRDILKSNYSVSSLRALSLRAQFKIVNGVKIKESLPVTIKNGYGIKTLQTDKSGYIVPSVEDLSVPENENLDVKLLTRDGIVAKTALYVENPMKVLTEYVVSIPNQFPVKDKRFQRTTDLRMKTSFTETNFLQEVVIGQSILAKAKNYGPNDCGDWVCSDDYLNCQTALHGKFDEKSHAPEKGKLYNFMYPTSGGFFNTGKITYTGCVWENEELAVFTARQFYGMDSTKLANVDEKEYLSTLFWKDFAIMPNTSSTSMNFYTGDLLGLFKIRVEGFASNGELYYTEKTIKVEK